MAEILSSKLANEHAQDLLDLEQSEVKKFLKIYDTARLEILGRLEQVKEESFEAQQLRYVLAQVKAGLDHMEERVSSVWANTYSTASQMAVAQKISEIQFWDKKWKGRAVSRVRTQSLRQLLDQRSLLLSQYEKSFGALRAQIEVDIRRRLSIHLIRNSSWRTMTIDIAGRLKRHAIRGSRWKAERIVRTELINVVGRSDVITLGNAAEEIAGLKMQWDTHWDTRTSAFCKRMHGRIRNSGEAFTQVGLGGYPVFHPPGHTWCRSRIVPWHLDWLDIMEEERVA